RRGSDQIGDMIDVVAVAGTRLQAHASQRTVEAVAEPVAEERYRDRGGAPAAARNRRERGAGCRHRDEREHGQLGGRDPAWQSRRNCDEQTFFSRSERAPMLANVVHAASTFVCATGARIGSCYCVGFFWFRGSSAGFTYVNSTGPTP